MAARSEAEINSLLVYKSPARQGSLLYIGRALPTRLVHRHESSVGRSQRPRRWAGHCDCRDGDYVALTTMAWRATSVPLLMTRNSIV